MGECGCGDREPMFWLRGPDGFFYTVTVFASPCRTCGSKPGVSIDLWTDDEQVMRDGVSNLFPPREYHAYVEVVSERQRSNDGGGT